MGNALNDSLANNGNCFVMPLNVEAPSSGSGCSLAGPWMPLHPKCVLSILS